MMDGQEYTFAEKELLIIYAMELRLKGRSIKKLAKHLNINYQQLYNWRSYQAGKTHLRADLFDAIWRYYTQEDKEAFAYAQRRLATNQKLWMNAYNNYITTQEEEADDEP